MATFSYDTDSDFDPHAKDCDCDFCHMDHHDPVVDWAICKRCEVYLRMEVQVEKGLTGI